ncbi:MAG: hypothetical protein H6739_26550 [Alphaproteobacteria bacterium]|nr:hypothetical protein [Alphaproteobacteria bacterium]
MFRNFFRRSKEPPEARPFWADAFNAPDGPPTPIIRVAIPTGFRHALGIALTQRGFEVLQGDLLRWRSPLRIAFLLPIPGDSRDLVVFAGHRMTELVEALVHESRLPLVSGDELADAVVPREFKSRERAWHIGLPSNWTDLCEGEDRQRVEAITAFESRYSERRAAGAATLARLEIFDRGPWVERAVVAWEESSGGGDISIAALLLHELTWLAQSGDPLADPVRALLHLMVTEREGLVAVVRGVPRPTSAAGLSRQYLMEQVPTMVAAAAAGVPPDRREGYAGPGRYESALRTVQDSNTRAALRVEAAQVMLARYDSGWNPRALEEVIVLLDDALYNYPAGGHPIARAQALILLSRARRGLGDGDAARALLEEAGQLIVDERGLPRDEKLAREILSRLE